MVSAGTTALNTSREALTAMPRANPTASPALEPPRPFRRRMAEWMFAHRLPVGLIFVAIGAFVAQPHSLWGEQRLWGSLASLALLFAGMSLRFWAAGSAGTHTHSATIEGPRLATAGPYAHVRNPIYLGSMLLGLGLVGLIGDIRLLPLHAAAFTVLYVILIPAEERFLQQRFGADYATYRSAVPRLIPRLRPWKGSTTQSFAWSAARGELRLFVVLLAIYGTLELAAVVRAQW